MEVILAEQFFRLFTKFNGKILPSAAAWVFAARLPIFHWSTIAIQP